MRKEKVELVLALFVFLILYFPGKASANRIGGDAYPFLKIGVGARALGMGGAFVAVADDGTAAYWNPAGLGSLGKREVSFMHTSVSGNKFTDAGDFESGHNLLSFVYPNPVGWKIGTVGLTWINLGVDKIPETSADEYGEIERKGFFTDSESAYMLSSP